jgi:acetyltransferase-like isoleucine patch superfamily enzyme
MNEQEKEAYQDLMQYHKINNKFLLKWKLGKLWLLHAIASKVPFPGTVAELHRMRGVKIGKNVYIGNDVHLDLFHPELITVEDYVTIGMRTMIFAHSSNWSPYIKSFYPRMTAPVKIGKGSWIAAGCMILPGVTIGENSVVAIGSVVIRDVQPYSVVMGNPAKFIKKLERNQASEWQPS